MSSVFGRKLKVSLFGESHGELFGITIHGLQSGIKIDNDFIDSKLEKRRPSNNISTSRVEKDSYMIISGVFNGYTTGAPLTVIIENKQQNSREYEANLCRPSHTDYVAHCKYKGFNDYRGSGHFSGRLTAAIVVAGAICETVLNSLGIEILYHVKSIGTESSEDILDVDLTADVIKNLNNAFPTLSESIREKYIREISGASKNNDSVGGSVQILVKGIEVGYGNPYFETIESIVSSAMYSVPGVKAIEFGKGLVISKSLGSGSNDEMEYIDGKVRYFSNNSGGVNGGITNGNDIVYTLYFRPTTTIAKVQKTIDIDKKCNVEASFEGRHDPCIVHRACHVASAMSAITFLDIVYWGQQ